MSESRRKREMKTATEKQNAASRTEVGTAENDSRGNLDDPKNIGGNDQPPLPESKPVENHTGIDKSEIAAALTTLFKEATSNPAVNPENIVAFVKSLVASRIVDYEKNISSLASGAESRISALRKLWDTHELENNEERIHLIEAVNEQVEQLRKILKMRENPEILKHEIDLNKNILLAIGESYSEAEPEPATGILTFGGRR